MLDEILPRMYRFKTRLDGRDMEDVEDTQCETRNMVMNECSLSNTRQRVVDGNSLHIGTVMGVRVPMDSYKLFA